MSKFKVGDTVFLPEDAKNWHLWFEDMDDFINTPLKVVEINCDGDFLTDNCRYLFPQEYAIAADATEDASPEVRTKTRSEIILQLAEDGLKAEDAERCQKAVEAQLRIIDIAKENLALSEKSLAKMLKEIDEGNVPSLPRVLN